MAQIPKREAIINALALSLGAKRAASDIDPRDLPARVLWSMEDGEVTRDNYGAINVVTGARVIDQQEANSDPDAWDSQGNEILAALIYDATSSDRTLGGYAEDLVYTAAAVMHPAPGSTIITVGIDLAIRWRHPIGNPYI